MRTLFSLIPFILLIANAQSLTRTYTKTVDLSPEYRVSWNIVGDSIQLALEVKTRGWIGFGLGELTSGSMPGADILTATITDGKIQIYDRHALEKAMPIVDDCPNWNLISGEETLDGTTVIEVERKLDTGDSQDRAIVAGQTRVLYAFGSTDEFGYHGASRHIGVIEFIKEDNPSAPPVETLQSIDFLMKDFPINAESTVYGCQSMQLPIGPNIQDFHIVRIEPIVDPITAPRVHHFLLKKCGNDSWVQNHINSPQRCSDETCYEYLWTWAPGIDALILPKEAGFRMGWSEGAVKFVSLQVHYDNPQQIAGLHDNSGVRVFYTTQLRQYDAGVLQLGDPTVSAPSIPPGRAMNHYEFNCPSDCTDQWTTDITVFSDFLHMHQLGKQMYTTHWRGDQLLGTLNRVDFYQFNMQQTTPVSRIIKKGDRLNTHCVFDSTTRTAITEFSGGSYDEMCIDFVFYYPMLSSGYCGYFRDQRAPDSNFTVCGFDKPFLDQRNPTIKDPALLPITFGANYGGNCPPITQTMQQEDNLASMTSISILLLIFVQLLFL